MQQIHLFAGFLGLCVALFSGAAQGQPGGKQQEDIERARARFYDAEAFFRVQEYEQALSAYKEAYLLSHKPAILFNIGQCYRYLERYKDALGAYESFLHDVPNTPLRPEIEKLIAEVKVLIAKKEKEEATRAQSATEPSSASAEGGGPKGVPAAETLGRPPLGGAPGDSPAKLPRSSRVLYGGAVAGASLGLIAGAVGLATSAQASRMQSQGEPDAQKITSTFLRARMLGIAADALLAGALISGVSGYWLSRRARKHDVSVSVGPQGAMVRFLF